MIAGQDPAVQAVIRASTWRLQQAVTAAINGEIRAMIAEGHDDGVVAIASCNAAAALLADAMIQQITADARARVLDGVTGWITAHVGDSLLDAAPVGSVLQ